MSCLLQVGIHIFYMYDWSNHIQSKLIHIQWQIGTCQSHIKYIQWSNQTYTDAYQIRTLVHSRYRSQQIHIQGSRRFRTYPKTNIFIDLYHNHIQTYTYSCQGIRFVSFTCFMPFSGFRSCSIHDMYIILSTCTL